MSHLIAKPSKTKGVVRLLVCVQVATLTSATPGMAYASSLLSHGHGDVGFV